MTIRSSDQISIVDVTDAYSVILTNEAHTFPGTVNAAKPGNTNTQIIVMQGAKQVSCNIVVSEISKPSGVTISSDSNTTSPTLTISVDGTVKTGGTIRIPVHIGDITINKDFSFSIAYAGTNGTSVKIMTNAITYQVSDSGKETPTGTWLSEVPDVPAGQYLWTKTAVTYSDGTTTISYSVSRSGFNGKDGQAVTVSSSKTTYQQSTNGQTEPTGTWSDTIPALKAGSYLWTKTTVTYSDGKTSVSTSVSRNGSDGKDGKNGTNGKDGQDAISLIITSSNGLIFKNTAISTTLTAHVYKGPNEITGTALSALGTLNWYKDSDTKPVATGSSLVIDVGDVKDRASFVCQLED